VGTYIHMAGSALIFIVLLIITHKEERISQNAVRIDSVAKDVSVRWDAMAKNDSASKRKIDSFHIKVAEYQKGIAANDEKFSEIEKELERIKLDQQKFNERIDKASPEELAAFYRTKKIPAR
jgi:septal ring factor EnvC (AmiA/AmiB activator)